MIPSQFLNLHPQLVTEKLIIRKNYPKLIIKNSRQSEKNKQQVIQAANA